MVLLKLCGSPTTNKGTPRGAIKVVRANYQDIPAVRISSMIRSPQCYMRLETAPSIGRLLSSEENQVPFAKVVDST
jgi:hypothetical protein